MSDNQLEIGIGLLGYGETGRRHARAWRAMAFQEGAPRVRLIAVADPDTEAAERALSEGGFEFIASSWEDLIAHPAVQVVDICTPATEHAPAIRSAMAAGKHISVSPPLAYTLREAEEIAGMAGRTSGAKFIASGWRSLPALALARELIEANFLGEPRRVCLRRLESVPAERLATLSPTDVDAPVTRLLPESIDLVRALAGEIFEVSASFASFPEGAMEGEIESITTSAMFRFVSGAVGSFQASTVTTVAPEMLVVELGGSDGAIRFDLATPNTLFIYDGTAEAAVRGWKALKTPGACDGELSALATFIAGAVADVPVFPNFRDGLMAHRVVDAMRHSAHGGAWEPVNLGR